MKNRRKKKREEKVLIYTHIFKWKDEERKGKKEEKRGYRKDACLTIGEFEKIVLHCILYYNNKRIIDFPFSEKMLSDGVKPYARDIFEWGVQQIGANLISVTSTKLIKVLLPRATGKFTRRGLQVNGLRYGNGEYAERFLQGGNALVAYNPDDVTEVWLIEKGQYIPFPLIDSRFIGKSLESRIDCSIRPIQ